MKNIVIILLFLFNLTVSCQKITINGDGVPITINNGAGTISVNRDDGVRELVILMGQSNAGSYHYQLYDNLILEPYGFLGLKDSIFTYEKSAGDYVNLNIPDTADQIPDPTTDAAKWGMEQHTINGLKDLRRGRRIYFTRYYAGGTSVDKWYAPGLVRTAWINRISDAIDEVVSDGFVPKITLIWIQGESDLQSQEEIQIYGTKLRSVITDFRNLRPPYSSNAKWISTHLVTSLDGVNARDSLNASMDSLLLDVSNYSVFPTENYVDDLGSRYHYYKEELMDFSIGLWAWIRENDIL